MIHFVLRRQPEIGQSKTELWTGPLEVMGCLLLNWISNQDDIWDTGKWGFLNFLFKIISFILWGYNYTTSFFTFFPLYFILLIQ